MSTTKNKKIKLLNNVTPLEFLPNLSNHLGPKIYIKRDDIGGRGGGGNKLRKYERIIEDAIAQNCNTLIIAGHYQSNAARALVGAACQMGLKAIIVCKEMIPQQNESFHKNGNALLMNLMDAKIIPIKKDDDFQTAMQTIANIVKKSGNKPYLIPFGGSNYLGALGYKDCADEIIAQFKGLNIPLPNHIFVANGSGGTQAGLVAGFFNTKTKITGVSVLHKKDTAKRVVADLATEILMKENFHLNVIPKIEVDDNFIGEGYGIPTKAGIKAIKLLAKLEGIFLCPVYTSKVMASLISKIEAGQITKQETIVFIHTGGMPLIHAYFNKLQ